MRGRKRLALLTGATVAAALVLAACGGGGGNGDDGGNGGDGGGATLSVSGGEFFFEPSELSAPADTTVTVEFENTGTIEHTFTLDEANLNLDVQTVGDSLSGTFTLPAGTYTFYCAIPGHRESGMEGTLTVS